MDEFELTFLPKEVPPGALQGPSKEMLDIYVPASADHPHLRLRRSGEKREITKKQPAREGDASHQTETTIPLSPAEFDELAQIPGKRVQKVRHLYAEGGHTYEIDVFAGDLAGLVIVDVEFPSSEAKAAYQRPEWLLADITQETALAGGMLAGKQYSDIAHLLEGFGYQKLG